MILGQPVSHAFSPFPLSQTIMAVDISLRDLPFNLVNRFLHMRHIVGQLPFRSVVAKHLDLAVANLGFGVRSRRRSAILEANHLCFDA